MKLEQQLIAIKNKIQKELVTGDRYLDGSLDYATAATGKMLRPTFLLIGATFGEEEKKHTTDNIISIAAAIESLHLATLLHDDIIDEAKLRRGQPSVQSKYSKEYALYMGDYILVRSFLMLSQLDVSKEVSLALAKTVNQICIGEMKQHKYRYNTNVPPMKYLRIVSRKTATLFSVSLSAGAAYCEAPQEICKKLARIGYEIGMAFQFVDDLLDYLGDEAIVGKDLEADIAQGYYNIPVLFALQSSSEKALKLKLLLEQGTTRDNKNELIELIKELGGIDKTKELAIRYNKRAMKLIDELPEGEGKAALLELTPKLLKRLK